MAGPTPERSVVGSVISLACVVILAAACTGGDEASASSAQPVASAEAAKVTDDLIRLTWTLPPNPVDQVLITRDGKELKQLSGSDTQFEDDGLAPGTRYRYEIATIAGGSTSVPAEVVAKTRVPSVSEARLDGTYDMVVTLLESNVSNPGPSVDHARWRLTPVCKVDACDVAMESLSGKYRLRLAWLPETQRYRGAVVRRNIYSCGSQDLDGTEQVIVTPDSARVIGSDWVATKLRGQIR